MRVYAVLALSTLGLAVAGAGVGRAAKGRPTHVYTANCGTVGYLEYKPNFWGVGCTSGSPEVASAKWTSWSRTSARATGKTYEENCSPSCARPSKHAFYQSSVILSAPRRCTRGAKVMFFSRATLTINYPRGNPFGERPGGHTETLVPLSRGTECRLS